MTPENPSEGPELDPIECELANGHKVRFVAQPFWEPLSEQERRLGGKSIQYYAIRIYTTEESLSRRMEHAFELRADKDFEMEGLQDGWAWLVSVVSSRAIYDYDSVEELIGEFETELDKCAATAQDAVDHIEKLPELQIPTIFDRIDDSIFTDQQDPEDKEK